MSHAENDDFMDDWKTGFIFQLPDGNFRMADALIDVPYNARVQEVKYRMDAQRLNGIIDTGEFTVKVVNGVFRVDSECQTSLSS